MKLYDENACKMPPVASALAETVPEKTVLDPAAGPVVDWSRIVQGEPELQNRTVSLIEAARAEHGESERPKASQPASFIGVASRKWVLQRSIHRTIVRFAAILAAEPALKYYIEIVVPNPTYDLLPR